MRARFKEGTVIFISVFKWFILATVVGALVGASTYVFLEILNWGFNVSEGYRYYYISLPIGLLLSAIVVKRFAKEAGGYGTEKIIEAIHRKSGKISPLIVPAKLITTVITLISGGSVGKVGPSAQVGAGLSSILADVVGFNDTDRRKLVICGISAGFSAVFGAPIAGAIFGIEVLFVGAILYDVLLPSFVAGIIGYQVASFLGVEYIERTIEFVPVFTESFFVIVALSGVFFGLCSFFFIEAMRWSRRYSNKLKVPFYVKAILGGCLLSVLVLFFSKDFLGLGGDVIQGALTGEAIPWYAFLVKILFTSVTFNSGGSGGIITPVFFVGASAGYLFAIVLGLNTATFSAIGLCSLLAGAVNTPITASILAVELFGSDLGSYAAIACIISFLITGHRSLFPSQLVAQRKSASIDVELGREVEEIQPRIDKRGRTVLDFILKLRGEGGEPSNAEVKPPPPDVLPDNPPDAPKGTLGEDKEVDTDLDKK